MKLLEKQSLMAAWEEGREHGRAQHPRLLGLLRTWLWKTCGWGRGGCGRGAAVVWTRV